jgi:hypothetical protein
LVGSEDSDMESVNSRATSAVCARLPLTHSARENNHVE